MEKASVVLVTNVGQGFGRAIALSFGQAGHDVVCADRDVDLATKTAAEIEDLGGQAIPIQADMATLMDVLNVFHKVDEIFGRLTGIVHVAALDGHTPFEELSEAEFSETLDETLRTTFLTLRTSIQHLRDAWLVLLTPPRSASEPHILAMRGALIRLAVGFDVKFPQLRINVATPSRAASDPQHDAPLVDLVRFLGSQEARGLSGHRLLVELPPPPLTTETLLPEVQAALDESIRQDELEARHYRDLETEPADDGS